jgi:hypothetical protein
VPPEEDAVGDVEPDVPVGAEPRRRSAVLEREARAVGQVGPQPGGLGRAAPGREIEQQAALAREAAARLRAERERDPPAG